MVIEVNKDIDRYQESVAMGLTARQLIFSIASVVVGGGIVLLLYKYIYFVCLRIAEYKEIMSDQFHLNTSFFRIHRFHRKFLGTNDLNIFIFEIIRLNK